MKYSADSNHNHDGSLRGRAEPWTIPDMKAIQQPAERPGDLSRDDVRERLWAYEDFTAAEEHPPFNAAGSLASLGFIGAAVRRSRRFWLTWAAVGMIIGLGVFVEFPVSYQATVTVLVKNSPDEDPVSAMLTQVNMAEARTVAANTVKSLGLTQSVSSFQSAYTATVVTDQVLSITVSAPTDAGAVAGANTVAAQYLKFRAGVLRGQQAQDVAALQQQVPQQQQRISSLQAQISQLAGHSAPASQTRLTNLRRQLNNDTTMLPTVRQTVTGLIATDKSTTSTMINGSEILNPATLMHHSKIKDVIEYVLSGLVGGLAVGLGFVIVRELISDRLRRRDDIAAALGAPVRMSVGQVRAGRLAGHGARASARRNLRRLTAYLHGMLPSRSRGPVTLAIVTVDNAREVAPAVTRLAEECAEDGLQVIVADLTSEARVAKLLGADGTGIRPARAGSRLVAFVPDPDKVTSVGPLRQGAGSGTKTPLAGSQPADELLVAFRSADVLLTVAELDPATGGDHLGTWADDAIAVLTAGRTRAARAYAAGEMLRSSGVHVITGAVVGADKTDESLGLPPESGPLADSRAKGPVLR